MSRAAGARRGLTLTWLVLFIASILLQYGALIRPASVLANAANNQRIGGFEIDGDLFSGTMDPAGYDWAQGTTSVGVLTAPTIVDPIGNADETNFTQGSKEGDSPLTWNRGTGTASPKTDMGNIYIASQLLPQPPGADSHLWTYLGVERASNTGTTYYDFEFNQLPNVTVNNPPNKGGPISVPNRSVGDILVVAEQQGNSSFDISATIQRWLGSAWSAALPAPAGAFYGLSNDAPVPAGPWTDTIATNGLIPQSSFAEMAFDLTAFGVVLTCPSQGFGEVNVRSRESISDTASLADYAAAPVRIPPTCATLAWQKQDGNSNPLGGATFTVTPNPFTGTGTGLDFTDYVSASAQSDATKDQDARAGFFKLINVVPGTYTVTEKTAPPGYIKDSASRQITLEIFEDGTIEIPFVNTRKTATTTLAVVGANPANGAYVAVGQSISLTVTETNTGQSVLHGIAVSGTNSCATWTAAANKNNGAGAFSGTLNPGESVNFTCTFNAPNVSDFSWSATATGLDELNAQHDPTGETVNGRYDVLQPATRLTIVQNASPQVHAGDSVTIIVNEKNDGEGAITSVRVDGTGPCASNWVAAATKVGGGAFSGSLNPGESVNFTCTFSAPANDFAWTADGKGTDALANAVPSTNEHQEGSVDVVSPSTMLTIKSAPAKVHAGDSVTIVVTEKNTGDGPLSNVNVVGGGACASFTPANVATLAAGASADFTCTFTASATGVDASWTADGKGTDALGAAAPEKDEHQEGTVIVIAPATTLELVSAPTTALHDTSVTIVVVETNTGDDTLTGVGVTGTNSCANWTAAANKNNAAGPFSGSLAPGQSVNFSCTFTVGTSDVSWTALGHGTDSLQAPAPAANEDEAGRIDVLNPGTVLTIKTDAPAKAYPADSIRIVVTETNTGDAKLFSVDVSGTGSCADWSPVGAFDGTLDPSESQDFECTFSAPADDFSWSATGHGVDALQNPAPLDNETVNGRVEVLNPSTILSIKTNAPAKAYPGDSIHIVVTETNNGDSTLTGVDVSGTGSCADWSPVGAFDGTLEPTESQDFECTFSAPADDFGWSATGHGTDELQNPAPDDDETVSGQVEVLNPATVLTIKTDAPDMVYAGDSIHLVVTETNSGDSTLTGVDVSGTGSCADWTPVGAFDGSLDPTESQDFECTFSAPADDFSWSATGHGTDELQNPAPDDNETVDGTVEVINPATTLTLVSETPDPVLARGSTTITVRETNVGDTPLTNVNVTGSPCATWTPVDAGFDGTLDPNESEDFTCTVADAGTSNIEWNALGHGTDPLENPAPLDNEDEAGSIHVVNPDIDVVKTAGSSLGNQAADGTVYAVEDGSTVVYRYAVTTQDPDGLTDVTVTDDLCSPVTAVLTAGQNSGDTNANGKLEPGETWVFTCSATLSIAEDGAAVHNIATASGTPLVGPDVDDTDDANVALLTPGIEIIKTAGDAQDGEVYVTEAGTDNVVYHYAITNTGELDLVNVDVVDDRGTPGNTSDDITVCTIPTLAVEETETCDITLTVLQTTTNVAVATGHTEGRPNDDVTDSDNAIVRVPDVSITKDNTDSDGIVGHGQVVTYTIDVTVVGGPVTNAVVTDTLPAGQTYVGGSQTASPSATFELLDGGRTLKWSWTSLASAAQISYRVTIDGDAPTGSQTNTAVLCVSELEDCRTSDSKVDVPDLTVAKSYTGNTGGTAVDGTPIAKIGDTLTYTLAYDLTGGPVNNGIITDTLPAGLTYVTGSATNSDEFSFVSYNSATRTLTWTAGTVTKDDSVTYRVTVDADSFRLDQSLVNVATIDSDETDKRQDTEKVFVQVVLAETDAPTPNITLPPTDGIDSGDQAPSNPGFGLMLALLVIAGIGLAAGLFAPKPGAARRQEVRRR